MNTAFLIVARLCNYSTTVSASLKNITDLAKKELPDTPITQGDLEALVDSGLLRRKGMSGYQLLSPCLERLTPSSEALYRMILVYLSARWDTPMDYETMRSLIMRSLRITPQHLHNNAQPAIGTPLWDGDDDPAFDAAYWEALERLEAENYLWRHERGWALSEVGDQHAFEIQGKNLTVWWIERHKDEIYATAPAFINRKLIETERERVDGTEIVNDYLTNIVARDTFRNRILEGKKIRVCNLRQFCYQHYIGTLRRASKDGHLRAMSPNYRTRREQSGKFIPMKPDFEVVTSYEPDHDGGFEIVYSTTAEDQAIVQDILLKAQAKLDRRQNKKRGITDLPEMLSLMSQGHTIANISKNTGRTLQTGRNHSLVIKQTISDLCSE